MGDEGAQGRAGDTALMWCTDWGTAGGRAEDDVPEETLPVPAGDEQLNLLGLEHPVENSKQRDDVADNRHRSVLSSVKVVVILIWS